MTLVITGSRVCRALRRSHGTGKQFGWRWQTRAGRTAETDQPTADIDVRRQAHRLMAVTARWTVNDFDQEPHLEWSITVNA